MTWHSCGTHYRSTWKYKQPFHLENEGEITDFGHILPDSQILLSSLRNCIFTDTCSIVYFWGVLRSYDADSFISGNTVVTRDPGAGVAPYHRIQKKSSMVKKIFESNKPSRVLQKNIKIMSDKSVEQ